ncbi:probable membrane-associated kinase regulator 2 [Rutidosis leptorrhynchoides]|uniref:probable membrane-associated kinase regulator 2 n=1 Tax=Rutidosis leptorrhynchoides TaxID=125765 RepID=UPI003A99646C
MEVFSLLKFWRNAGVGDPINAGDFDISDDESSFFDLVFTNPNSLNDNNHCSIDSPSVHIISDFHTDHHLSKINGCDLKSNHMTYSKSPRSLFSNNKSKISPLDSSSNNSKTPRSPFRVLMLGLHNNNKSKLHKKEMKCEIQEVTISSLLKRDNSLRNKLRSEKLNDNEEMHSKRFSKEVVHKYLNLIKPLYVRVSKRSNEKLHLSSANVTASFCSPRKEEKPLGKTVLNEMRKHLGKSRSSSSTSVTVKPVSLTALRRDDSALQQQDGIQSAILHCKKSYNSPSQGCNLLSRSGSAPSHGARISVDEEKRISI